MKLFTIVAWISGIIAVALIIFGTIALFMGSNPFGIRHEINYFLVSSNLLLLAILCLLAQQGCRQKKD
ncbi:MAG: hypothetical protein JW830_14445 [Bacteroidales bacterium]|nr:hypothetical protein [Bacteroidales bacterium]